MSRQFTESFFPYCTGVLKQHFPTVYSTILPIDIGRTCPQVIIGQNIPIRNPILACWAICGLVLGAVGCRDLHKWSPYWSVAFAFFGMMNAVALPLHCYDPCISFMGDLSGYYWMLDCLFTGVSGLALLAAAIEGKHMQHQMTKQRHRLPRLIMSASALISALLATGFVVLLVSTNQRDFSNLPYSIKFYLELWYLIPIILAGLAILPQSFVLYSQSLRRNDPFARQTIAGIHLIFVGGLVVPVIIFMDASFCKMLGVLLLDALMLPTAIFAGCDCCFLGLFAVARSRALLTPTKIL